MLQADNGNNVWDTLVGLGSSVLNTARDIKLAKIKASTTAAPSGELDSRSFNPFPGIFSAYPQADGKPGAAPVVAGGFFSPTILLMIAAALVVVLVIGRR